MVLAAVGPTARERNGCAREEDRRLALAREDNVLKDLTRAEESQEAQGDRLERRSSTQTSEV